MPLMEMTFPEGAVPDEKRDELFDGMTAALLKAEGAPDTEFFRNITWIHVNELPRRDVIANGRPLESPAVKVEVTTPQGALSDRRRKILVADLTAVIREATGIAEQDALMVWILCREIDEGSWGAGGGVVEFEALKAAAKQEREAAGTASAPVG